MYTEKAIELIKSMKDGNVPSSYSKFCKEYNEKLDEIIKVIEDGGKYEAIVKDVESDFDNLHCTIMSNKSFKIIKQKYFPKPKTEIWERFINVDFPNSESTIVKMVAIKKPDGNLMISYEPQYNYSEKLEKGVKFNGSGKNN